MSDSIKQACDAVLAQAVTTQAPVPGVVAMVTNEHKTLYSGAAGQRELGGQAMTEDTVFAIFSCTKGLTATAVMQQVERGLIDLNAPAEIYAPELANVQVLEGFDSQGQPQLRAPKSKLTTHQLLLHTAGFAYDFFSEKYLRMAEEQGLPSVITSSMDALRAPLLFDPGTDWNYGINMDWAGKVVEGVTGKSLGEVMKSDIFAPLGMDDTAFVMSDDMLSRRATLHQREEDGSLTALPDLILPQEPEVHMGGHGLYGSISDYMKFIRMFLNDGQGEHGQVIKPETLELMVTNQLGDLKISMLPGVIPTLSNDAEFFPGMPKSWSYSFMVNEQQAPTGRPAGAIGWAGLANLFYWIDVKAKLGGMWATQILPFADATSFTQYMDFEKAVYDHY